MKGFKKGFERKRKEKDPFSLWLEESEVKPVKKETENDARELLEDHGSPKYNPRLYYY